MNQCKAAVTMFLCGLCAGFLPLLPQSEPRPFLLVPSSSTYAHGQAWETQNTKNETSLAQAEGPLQSITSPVNVSGGEQSECNFPEQDVSYATAYARVDNLLRDSERLRFKLHSSAAARGGHFVKCVACVFRNCIGLLPVNPSAQAFSRASVAVDLAFRSDSQLLPYNINILSSLATDGGSSPNVKFRIADAEGTTVAEGNTTNQTIRIPGGPGLSYRISVESTASAGHSDKIGGETDLTVSVALAPLMESFEDHVIGGGEKTERYPEVGALLLNGDGHCTGTLIGRKTVLTAAHCVYWFSARDLTFAIGSNYKNAGPRSAVTEIIVPRFDRDGFNYNEANRQHDIAIVRLADEFPNHYVLPDQAPGVDSLETMKDRQDKLVLVGFGHKRVNGRDDETGPKRETALPIFALEEGRLIYHTAAPGACKGDSGGPALVQWNGSFIVQGIASTGDCRGSGTHVRVEHYTEWIRKFLKDDPAFVATPPPPTPAAPAAPTESN